MKPWRKWADKHDWFKKDWKANYNNPKIMGGDISGFTEYFVDNAIYRAIDLTLAEARDSGLRPPITPLIMELIRTDKTVAKVCEEKNVKPTDYPELFEVTEAVENIRKEARAETAGRIENTVGNFKFEDEMGECKIRTAPRFKRLLEALKEEMGK